MLDSEPVTYERRDLNSRAAMWFGFWLVVVLIGVFVGMRLFLSALNGGASSTRITAPQVEVPPPRLQANPAAELAELRAAEEAQLHSYGWVDRQAGIVRVPIERAMALTLERGLPARTPEKGGAP